MKNDYEIRGDVTAIFLTRKDGTILETLIDTVDFDKANSFLGSWYAHWEKSTRSYYVHGHIYRNATEVTISLHRFLTDAIKGSEVDHIDHETLNNRRLSNLRVLSKSMNQQNRNGANRNSASGIRGVSWHKRAKKWRSQLKVNNKVIDLGTYDDINDAEKAVISGRKKYHQKSS